MFWKKKLPQDAQEQFVLNMLGTKSGLQKQAPFQHKNLLQLCKLMDDSDFNIEDYYRSLDDMQGILERRICRLEELRRRERDIRRLIKKQEIPWYAKLYCCCAASVDNDEFGVAEESLEAEHVAESTV